jgi:(S)-mandelate dehydrogenase
MAVQARRRVPRFALDYLEGGIGEELGLQRNREDLDDIILCPRYLRDVTNVDTSCELFGRKYDLGIGISPVGLGNMMWPRAEQILSTTAQRMNIPYILSTMSTTPLEDIVRLAPDVSWFQLYVPKDVAIMQDLLQRVNRAGFKVLVITVDIPVGAKRDRELKNGLILPFRLTPGLLLQVARRPRWAIETLRHGTPRFVNLDSYVDTSDINHLSEFLTSFFMCGVTLERIKMIRSLWQGSLVIKGLLHAEDIEAVVKLGVDGVIVSNHAGRQLDAAPSSARALQVVPDHLKRETTILMDSGIRTGLDIVRARALGAKACFSGRSFMYGVAGAGDDGVRQAIEIFRDEITRTLQQLGCVQFSAMDHTWIEGA